MKKEEEEETHMSCSVEYNKVERANRSGKERLLRTRAARDKLIDVTRASPRRQSDLSV